MKKNKIKKYETEEQMEVKKFIFVLVGLIIILIGVYFFTRAFITKDLNRKTEDISYTEGKVNYNVVVVGTLLNRPNKEYYVVAYSSDGASASYYNTLTSKYMSKENTLSMYYLDLENELNKEYVANDDNVSKSLLNLLRLKRK